MSDPESPHSPSSAGLDSLGSILARFIHDLWVRPGWHKAVLLMAVLSAGWGWAHLGYRAATENYATTAPAITIRSSAPPPSSPFWAPMARRIGGSILLGFVIGWMFRTFIRMMAALTAVVIGGLVLLSYFHIMNVDLTVAENKTTQASAWVRGQAGRLRDVAWTHVHSTLGGAVGMFMGVRRKRI